jgi:hypothetical protein
VAPDEVLAAPAVHAPGPEVVPTPTSSRVFRVYALSVVWTNDGPENVTVTPARMFPITTQSCAANATSAGVTGLYVFGVGAVGAEIDRLFGTLTVNVCVALVAVKPVLTNPHKTARQTTLNRSFLIVFTSQYQWLKFRNESQIEPNPDLSSTVGVTHSNCSTKPVKRGTMCNLPERSTRPSLVRTVRT